MLVQGIVQPPTAQSLPDTSSPVGLTLGKQGELIVNELGAKNYTQCLRGNIFSVSTVVAGLAIPISTTTAPTVALWNPAGSGKNAVLIRFNWAYVSGTSVGGAFGLQYQLNAGNTVATGAVYSAFANSTALNGIIGGGNTSVVRASAAGTNTLSAAGTNVVLWMNHENAVLAATAVNGAQMSYDFDGLVIVPPGVTVYVVGSAASGALLSQTLVWAELPI